MKKEVERRLMCLLRERQVSIELIQNQSTCRNSFDIRVHEENLSKVFVTLFQDVQMIKEAGLIKPHTSPQES